MNRKWKLEMKPDSFCNASRRPFSDYSLGIASLPKFMNF